MVFLALTVAALALTVAALVCTSLLGKPPAAMLRTNFHGKEIPVVGGLVILSGLLPPQARGVIAAYRARGLVPVRHLRIEGWSSLLLRRVG